MSLIKQLWLGILIVTLGAFAASFVISTLSARDYLQQQLDQRIATTPMCSRWQ